MNSSCIELTAGEFDERNIVIRSPLYYVLAAAYGATAIGSLLGNGGILFVVMCKKDMRSVTNIFISSLAVADLLVTATTFWITPLHFTQKVFKFGGPMCYLSVGLGGACFFWTPLILTAMAVDRYIMVMMPLQTRISRVQCFVIVLLIGLIGGIMIGPALYHLQYLTVSDCQHFCIEVWRDNGRLAYSASILFIRSIIPFIVITFSHSRIAKRLEEQGQRLNEHRTTLRRAHESQRKKRLEKLLILMVLVFAFSTFPLDIFNLLQDIEQSQKQDLMDGHMRSLFYLLTFLIAMTGTLWNPLIYAWWNENFKREMFAVMECSQKRFSVTAAAVLSRSGLGRKSLSRGPRDTRASPEGSGSTEHQEKHSLLGRGYRQVAKPSLTQSTKPTSLQSYSSTSDVNRLRSGTGNRFSLPRPNVPNCEWEGKAVGIPPLSNPPTPTWLRPGVFFDTDAIEEISE